MAMSIGEALHYLYAIDYIYYNLYLEKTKLLGEMPCGSPGYPGFSTVDQVAQRIEKRKAQILEMRLEIQQLRNAPCINEDEIRAIAAEFNLPAFEG